MRDVRPSNRFLRDLKRARKRGKNIDKLEAVIDTLVHGVQLLPKHRRHRLVGTMSGLWECHVEPDWLLIWHETEEHLVLVRTGTHADLFE